MEAVARACHELRGPLTAARLGLAGSDGAASCPRRAPAGDRHRAGPGGARARRPVGRADGGAPDGCGGWTASTSELLAADCVEAWQATAAAAGEQRQRGMEWGGGGRVGRPAAAGPGAGQPDRQRRSSTGEGRSGSGVAVRGATGAASRSPTTGRGCPRRWRELRRRPRRGRGTRGRGLAIAADVAEAHGGALVSAPSRADGARPGAASSRLARAGAGLRRLTAYSHTTHAFDLFAQAGTPPARTAIRAQPRGRNRARTASAVRRTPDCTRSCTAARPPSHPVPPPNRQ